VRVGGKRISKNDMDQIHISDPVSQELCRMQIKIQQLEQKLAKFEKDTER